MCTIEPSGGRQKWTSSGLDIRREAWPLHLQNSAFPTVKDTIKISRLQCLPVLDNLRADVYNKDKERRCPCKRLAPHRHTVKKNDRHRWKLWAVISFCRYCHYRAKSAMQCQKWHARPEPTTSVNWQWRPEVQRLQQESCGIPPYSMSIGRKTSKSALPCSFRSKERCSKAGRSIAACVWRNSAFPANKDTTKTDRKQSFSLLTGGKDILYNTVIEILARTSG